MRNSRLMRAAWRALEPSYLEQLLGKGRRRTRIVFLDPPGHSDWRTGKIAYNGSHYPYT